VTFGSPLSIASVYTNPKEIYRVPERQNLWGTFSFLPYPTFVVSLLFGPSRGILFTQPWVLVLFGCVFFVRRDRELLAASLFTGLALGALVWMNGGFGGWHAGWTIGPRYLSLAFLPSSAARRARLGTLAYARAAALGRTGRLARLPLAVACRSCRDMPSNRLGYAWQLLVRSKPSSRSCICPSPRSHRAHDMDRPAIPAR
jgi:hypothetical protein